MAKHEILPMVDLSLLPNVKPGDVVVRALAGVIPVNVRVTAVDDQYIQTAGPEGWKFDKKTGYEIDEDIPITVSHITAIIKENEIDDSRIDIKESI